MRRSELSLGVRLALAGGRGSMARLVVTAVGVALGVALLLAAGAIGAAMQQRADRTDWREPTIRPLGPSGLDAEAGSPALLWRVTLDRFEATSSPASTSRPWARMPPCRPGWSACPVPAR